MPTAMTPERHFEFAQAPSNWLRTAQDLQRAADALVTVEAALEPGYQSALDKAHAEAEANAAANPEGSGTAEIRHQQPNYLPAVLLYGFAIENVLKGLIITQNPGMVSQSRIDSTLTSHNLVKLASDAGIGISDKERAALEGVSFIAEWAGRYPVAKTVHQFTRHLGRMPVVHAGIFEWQHLGPTVMTFFTRVAEALTDRVQEPRVEFGVVVVLSNGD